MRVFLISNMYPSEKNSIYGIFVKNSEDILINGGFLISAKAVIRGKGRHFIEKIIKYIFFYYRILWLGIKSDYDLIYVHFISHSAIPLLFLRLFIKKKLILNVHGSDVISQKYLNRFLFHPSKVLCKKAELIVSPSEYFKKIVAKKFHIPDEKIFVYPSGGVDMNIFKPMEVKKEFNKFTIGFISRIDAGKGWDIYLQALHFLKTKYPEIDFHGLVIGDGAEKKAFLEMRKQLFLEKHISYYGAKLQKELPWFYNQMDVFVFPSDLNESLGVVGLEAISCKVPVICSNRGGSVEYIRDNWNGLLFKAGDYEDLTKEIATYFHLPAQKKILMKEQAFQTAVLFEKNIVAGKLFNILKKIVVST